MNQLFAKLDSLIADSQICNYTLETVDIDGNVVKRPLGSRNSERLTIEFNNGQKLAISTFCSGSSENTCFITEGKL